MKPEERDNPKSLKKFTVSGKVSQGAESKSARGKSSYRNKKTEGSTLSPFVIHHHLQPTGVHTKTVHSPRASYSSLRASSSLLDGVGGRQRRGMNRTTTPHAMARTTVMTSNNYDSARVPQRSSSNHSGVQQRKNGNGSRSNLSANSGLLGRALSPRAGTSRHEKCDSILNLVSNASGGAPSVIAGATSRSNEYRSG